MLEFYSINGHPINVNIYHASLHQHGKINFTFFGTQVRKGHGVYKIAF
jgi:hypothetical protein